MRTAMWFVSLCTLLGASLGASSAESDPPNGPGALFEAQARHHSAARREFTKLLEKSDGGFEPTLLRAFDLASLVAAEEKHATESPSQVLTKITDAVDDLTTSVRMRLMLAKMYSHSDEATGAAAAEGVVAGSGRVQQEEPRLVAVAALSSLFGTNAADDRESDGFFTGNQVLSLTPGSLNPRCP